MMSDAEVITILICFHFNFYRNFKHYYQACVCAFRTALSEGIHVVTGLRSNMKQRLMPLYDKIMLRRGAL